jgi:hypothetical protein
MSELKWPVVPLQHKGQQIAERTTRHIVSHHGAYQTFTFAGGEHPICLVVSGANLWEGESGPVQVWEGLVQICPPFNAEP